MCTHIILKKCIIQCMSPQHNSTTQYNLLYFFDPDLGFLIIFATPLLNVPTISPTSSFSYW